jgi:hypothetical protein
MLELRADSVPTRVCRAGTDVDRRGDDGGAVSPILFWVLWRRRIGRTAPPPSISCGAVRALA